MCKHKNLIARYKLRWENSLTLPLYNMQLCRLIHYLQTDCVRVDNGRMNCPSVRLHFHPFQFSVSIFVHESFINHSYLRRTLDGRTNIQIKIYGLFCRFAISSHNAFTILTMQYSFKWCLCACIFYLLFSTLKKYTTFPLPISILTLESTLVFI